MATKDEKSQNWHNVIITRAVFSKNNQVYLRKDETPLQNKADNNYYPINFYWKPVLQLEKTMKIKTATE